MGNNKYQKRIQARIEKMSSNPEDYNEDLEVDGPFYVLYYLDQLGVDSIRKLEATEYDEAEEEALEIETGITTEDFWILDEGDLISLKDMIEKALSEK